MLRTSSRLLLAAVASLFGSLWVFLPAWAQFSTVINVPPNPAPASIGSDTQLNLGPSGTLPSGFLAGATDGSSINVEVNISGGSTGQLMAYHGATVNVSGGTVSNNSMVNDGAVMNVSGGYVDSNLRVNSGGLVNFTGGDINVGMTIHSGGTANIYARPLPFGFTVDAGANVNLYGSDFRYNNVPVTGLDQVGHSATVDMPILSPSSITGTFADGTPFGISWEGEATFEQESKVTIHAIPLPPIGPPLIRTSIDPLPRGIRQGQKLIVDSFLGYGGTFAAGTGSIIEMQKQGYIPFEIDTIGATISLPAGRMGGNFYDGTKFTMTGGEFFGGRIINSQATITGGTISGGIICFYGSTLNISAGTFQYAVQTAGGTTNISGGSIPSYVDAQDGTLNITGGTIGAFGYVWGTVNMSGGSVGNAPAQSPAFVGGILNLTGGTVGDSLIGITGGVIKVSGGSLGKALTLQQTSVATVTGGSIGDNLSLVDSANLGILRGTIGDHVSITGTSAIMTLSGGAVGKYIDATNGRINISGGTTGDAFHASGSARVFLYGKTFLLNGQAISLVVGQSQIVSQRNATLSGTLVDGTPFSFDLNSTANSAQDYFSTSARVTVQLVSGLKGDYNQDGAVNGADYTLWRHSLGQIVPNGTGADGDFSGVVDQLDFALWRASFGGTPASGAAAVPEPAALFLVVVGCFVMGARRRR